MLRVADMSAERYIAHARSRDGLKVRPTEQVGTCDGCGGTFRLSDLRWVSDDWTSTDGRRGHVTATLCPECDRLALAHCWSCGRLTGREDDQCVDCCGWPR